MAIATSSMTGDGTTPRSKIISNLAWRLIAICNIFFVVGLAGAAAQPGPDTIKKAMSELDKSFGQYYWTAYPVETWGVGSVMNDDDRKGNDPFKNPKYNHIPGWAFFGLEAAPNTPQDKIVLSRQFVHSDKGPSISLDKKTASETALKASLPLIGSLLGLKGDISKVQNVTVALTFAALERRGLDKTMVRAHLGRVQNGQPGSVKAEYADEVKRLSSVGRLFIVTDDILIHGIELDVKFNSGTAVGTEAEFKGALEKHLGKAANAALKVDRKNEGHYVLKVAEPFVFARFGRNFKAWK